MHFHQLPCIVVHLLPEPHGVFVAIHFLKDNAPANPFAPEIRASNASRRWAGLSTARICVRWAAVFG